MALKLVIDNDGATIKPVQNLFRYKEPKKGFNFWKFSQAFIA